MPIYHEIARTRHYQFRQWSPEENEFSTWCDAGPATPQILAAIKAGFSPHNEYEVPESCYVTDESSNFIGTLVFSKIVHSQVPK